MKIIARKTQRRSGATIVESTLVLSTFLLFLFGIFEYARLLAMNHVATSAARAGVRYASVNVDKGSTFDVTDYNTSTPSIKKYVTAQMGGMDKVIDTFNVTVFPCDNAKMYQDPPVIAPKSSYSAWYDATFTERIAVKITGSFKPILPVFVFKMVGIQSIPLNVTAVSGGEN